MIAINCGERFMRSVALVFDLAAGFLLLVTPARTSGLITPNYDHTYGGCVVTGPQGCTHPERT